MNALKGPGWQESSSEQPAFEVRQQHHLVRAQDLGRLGHEAHAAEHDDIRVRAGGLARQIEGIAHEIGEILNLGVLVIMREDDGVHLAAQTSDLRLEIEERINIGDRLQRRHIIQRSYLPYTVEAA